MWLVLDEVRLRRVEAESEHLIREAETASDTNFKRLIHDELIGTIRAVADTHVGDERLVRHACLSAIESVTAARGSMSESTLPEVVSWCEERSRVRLVTDLGDSQALPVLPPSQADAVRRALGEALRNVARHSGVQEATVRARLEADWFTLEVIDGGRGPKGQSLRSWGVATPFRRRSTPSGGTSQLAPVGLGGRA